MKKLGNVLYIMTEGSYLHCENRSICVMVGGTEKTRIPAHTIDAIICLCNTSVSTPFIGFCGDNGISLSFHSDNGRFYGRVYGQVSGNVLLRKKQYQLIDSCESVEIVRNIILGKTINSRNMLMRASRNTSEEKAVTLKEQAEKLLEQEQLLASAKSIDSIRGVEGAAASIYFRAFDSMLKTNDPEMLFYTRLHCKIFNFAILGNLIAEWRKSRRSRRTYCPRKVFDFAAAFGGIANNFVVCNRGQYINEAAGLLKIV